MKKLIVLTLLLCLFMGCQKKKTEFTYYCRQPLDTNISNATADLEYILVVSADYKQIISAEETMLVVFQSADLAQIAYNNLSIDSFNNTKSIELQDNTIVILFDYGGREIDNKEHFERLLGGLEEDDYVCELAK